MSTIFLQYLPDAVMVALSAYSIVLIRLMNSETKGDLKLILLVPRS